MAHIPKIRVLDAFSERNDMPTPCDGTSGAQLSISRWVYDFRSTIATATVEIVTGSFADDDAAYVATTEQILQRAIGLGGRDDTIAIVAWDGIPRHDSVDHAALFVNRARELGLRIEEVSTLR